MTDNHDRRAAVRAMLDSFIMQYDQKIKIGNKRNVEATDRAEASILDLIDTECLAILDTLLEEKEQLSIERINGSVLVVPVSTIESLRTAITNERKDV